MFKKLIERRKERKRVAYENELMRRTGLRFSREIIADKDSFPLAKYIVNALALFGAVYGSLATVISCFSLNLNQSLLFGICVILSLVMSFMYVNEKVKIIIYILILFGCIGLVGMYYLPINSGVSAFHNITIKAINNVMELDQIREYMEFYENQYVSMTFAFSVVALAMSILVNIAISEYMNFFVVFVLTFPVVQYGMFFGYESNKFNMISVIGSWLLVASVRYTNSYNGLNNELKSIASVKKHKHRYGFITDSNNVSRIALTMLAFILSFNALLMIVVPQQSFEMASPINRLRSRANDTVNKVLSYGISSILPFNAERMDSGELSNTGSLKYDGQVDLKVTLVNYGEDRMYLRDYVGVDYRPYEFRWSFPNDSFNGDFSLSSNLLKFDYDHSQYMSNTKRKMRINVIDKDAVGKYSMFIPYYAELDGDYESNNLGMIIPKNKNLKYDNTYTFYTVDNRKSSVYDIYYDMNLDTADNENASGLLNQAEEAYQNLHKLGYYKVPEENVGVIDEFLNKYNISAADEDVVNEVIAALAENYDYTLKPGTVPRGEDYVNYFLKSSKKGYCMHFASAATLIFRRLNIAARYVEGYVVDQENFEFANEESDLKISDYVEGEEVAENAVETVSLPDSNGHAWVELFSPGFGWQPVEVTQAASIDEDNQGTFSRIFGIDSVATATADDIINQVEEIDIERTGNRIKVFIGVILLLFVMYYIFKLISTRVKIMIRYNGGSYRTSIGNRISDLIDIYKYNNSNQVLSYEEFSDILLSESYISDVDKKLYDMELEKAMFAKGDISDATYRDLVGVINRSRKLIIANMTFKNKIRLYLVDFKW